MFGESNVTVFISVLIKEYVFRLIVWINKTLCLTIRDIDHTFGDMHLVRAANLTGILELLDELALDSELLFEYSGIPLEMLDNQNADQYIPMANIEKLYAMVEQQSQKFDLAFRMGRNQDIATLLGVLGFVMQQAKNVGEAFAELQHYFSFQVQGASIKLDIENDYVALVFVVHEAHRLASIRYMTEFAIGAGVSILKSLCGDDWKPTEIHIEHTERLPSKKLEKYLHAPVRSNRGQSAIIFPAKDLLIPIAGGNLQLENILQSYLAQLESQFTKNPTAQIEKLIQQAITTGSCSADKVAAFMGIHRRTLHRRLQKLDTSYTQLLDKVRKDTALRMLKQGNMSITLISDVLCYSELSAFSRAFRSWTGVSPQKFRASD